MSKTVSAAICETNMLRGLPQENVFLHTLYRTKSEYASSFQRSVVSTAPVQICAVFSAQGDDALSAMALQEVLSVFSSLCEVAKNRSILDFRSFSDQIIAAANQTVCNFSLSHNGTPIRVSMTMVAIEGDILRVVSVGNTRAALVRQGKIIPITEDQTVAHRYVQMGAIPPETEQTHPERNVLTQYIGRFPQDGPVLPENKFHAKLMDNDEICLYGTGISQALPPHILKSLLVRPTPPEQKTTEIIRTCMQGNIKGGLSIVLLKIESTLILPAAAAYANTSSVLSAQVNQMPPQTMPVTKPVQKTKWQKAKPIVIPFAVFLGCILFGYLGTMFAFNASHIFGSKTTTVQSDGTLQEGLNIVMYVTEDSVGLYSSESLDTSPTAFLMKGDVVTVEEKDDVFCEVTTTDGVSGYVLTTMLSTSDPTINDLTEETGDPTPIPTEKNVNDDDDSPSTTKATTKATEEIVATPVPSPTPVPSAVTPVPSVTPEPSVTPQPSVTPVP